MAQVDEHAELGTARHERVPGVGQARADVGGVVVDEGNAVGERVAAAPDRSERAQAHRVPGLQRGQPRIDRLRALEMQDGDGWSLAAPGAIDVGDRARDADEVAAFQREQPPGRLGRVRRGHLAGDGVDLRELDDRAVALQVSDRLAARRGEDREDAAAQAAGAHPRQIEMAAVAPAGERGVVLAREHVVVPVEDGARDRRRRGRHGAMLT